MCGNRIVLFDNVTEDEAKIFRQREELVFLVEAVVEQNGGKPYMNNLFDELKASEFELQAFGFSSKLYTELTCICVQSRGSIICDACFCAYSREEWIQMTKLLKW